MILILITCWNKYDCWCLRISLAVHETWWKLTSLKTIMWAGKMLPRSAELSSKNGKNSNEKLNLKEKSKEPTGYFPHPLVKDSNVNSLVLHFHQSVSRLLSVSCSELCPKMLSHLWCPLCSGSVSLGSEPLSNKLSWTHQEPLQVCRCHNRLADSEKHKS